MMDMDIELCCCTETLLTTIEKAKNRKEVATVYSWALRSSEETEWGKVNRAIIDRWSMSALEYIKNLAWKIVAEDE